MLNPPPQAFAEDGTLTALRRAWFDGLSQCSDQPVLYNNQLGIPQMLGAFAFLAFGLVAAFATGTLENLRWCLLHCLPAPPPPQQQDGHMDEALRTVSVEPSCGRMPTSVIPAVHGSSCPSVVAAHFRQHVPRV